MKKILIILTVLALFVGVGYRYQATLLKVIVEVALGPLMPNEMYDNEYGIHPTLLKKVNATIADAKKEGIDLRVLEGFRTPARQRIYYQQGRTSPGAIITHTKQGFSFHNHGWAVDLYEFKDGLPVIKSKNWNKIGRLGKRHGLVWGGDWKSFVDKPHFQLRRSEVF